ncbi:hypothetical protein C1H46_042144 [Malus baccata]|uniref:Uncharacterized protein n=1 Tax=Malus baccata TaxID=106549 RepID=A0A540KDX7_MALBA|nr:hypothetical protein C1H46_042144 [Malus baccata]
MDLSGAVYRVKLQGGVPLDLLEPVYKFFEKEPLPYLHSQCARIFSNSNSKLYRMTQEWHWLTSGHTGFVGRAVVVDQTIYGLSLTCDKVLAFSFGISYGEEGCTIACRLCTPIPLQVLDGALKPSRFSELTGQLVHPGDKDFCLVQTRDDEYSFVHQDICITTFQIVVGEEGCPMIKTMHSTVDTNELGPFGIYCSFTA